MRDVINSLKSHARTKARVQDISPKQRPPRTEEGVKTSASHTMDPNHHTNKASPSQLSGTGIVTQYKKTGF